MKEKLEGCVTERKKKGKPRDFSDKMRVKSRLARKYDHVTAASRMSQWHPELCSVSIAFPIVCLGESEFRKKNMEQKKGVIGFAGFDDMSLELADSLVRAGYAVQAFDSQMGMPSMVELSERLQGTRCASAAEAATGVAAIVVLISHPQQIDSLFFGPDGILQGSNKNALVILRAHILPADIQRLEKRLTEECEINSVVDAYVSRGMSEDLSGKIVIVSSGQSDAIARAQPVLSGMCEKIFVFDGEIGIGSKVKMVSELLRPSTLLLQLRLFPSVCKLEFIHG
ncbi:hypothetical protein Cgig2_023097 [Carnegiea gigantea]|uniref:6-phosphogluconate dehydrogenase NADP-binding domain-containing protein n=1 Tax=Carnegiea gigantea TaxID=171969 RepID=A0A9Q1JRT1_9CARY|nr:hypothetical protein Cgig2_023097 [Carnegiea gigantea]